MRLESKEIWRVTEIKDLLANLRREQKIYTEV